MIRTNKQWEMWCREHGASSDQVPQILEDWRESEGIVNQRCEWRIDVWSENNEIFKTECCNLFFTDKHWPREDGMNFCPFCGNEIVISDFYIMEEL
jgi:hypothetical protein